MRKSVFSWLRDIFAMIGAVSVIVAIIRAHEHVNLSGNRITGFDTHQYVEIAYLKTDKGVVKIPVKHWRDYSDRCVQIIDTNNVSWTSCYENMILVERDPDKKK